MLEDYHIDLNRINFLVDIDKDLVLSSDSKD